MSAAYTPELGERLATLLSDWKLSTLATELVPRFTAAGQDEALALLAEVSELEADARKERRVDRLRRASKLPPAKTFDTLERDRVPRPAFLKIQELANGDFLDRADNVLLFGMPGVGKSHLACALGHALVERGRSVLFTPTYQLVQALLAARRDLVLPKALRSLDVFDAIILDDLGYVQQTADEAEVLFTLMAERYERRSLRPVDGRRPDGDVRGDGRIRRTCVRSEQDLGALQATKCSLAGVHEASKLVAFL